MVKVKVNELKPGDIIAEHILNSEGQVLLAAGTALTHKSISLLTLWGIPEMRIREEKDTEDDIRLSLQFDEIIAKNSQLFDKIKKIADSPSPAVQLPTIINQKATEQYHDIAHAFSAILADLPRTKEIAPLKAIANIICQYTANTVAVLAYTLNRKIASSREENLTNHSLSVAIISAKIAGLLGYPEETIQTIIVGALIHDIGKTALPETVLNREDCRSAEEESLYQSHVQSGYERIKSLGLPREATFILLQHHEYKDGSGFPLHLAGSKIHPYAQIVGFANFFDALLHEKNKTPDFFKIRQRLMQEGATRFDTTMIDRFDHYLESFAFNVNVELNDGRTAEVIYNHPFHMSLVVRTTAGECIDLSKNKELFIAKLVL